MSIMIMRYLPAEVIITRINSAAEPSYMLITLTDSVSRCKIVQVKLSMEEFMNALTSHAGFGDATWTPQNLGKRRIVWVSLDSLRRRDDNVTS